MNLLQSHLHRVLPHLYINPLEKCNLRCKICYTKKTAPILSNDQMWDFISRYQRVQKLETVTFCGGEVFALASFPTLVNQITNANVLVQVITNGSLDRLAEIARPNWVNVIVSLDGCEQYHDANRGSGNFQKSTAFLRKAHRLGFHTDVFSIVTRQNLPEIDRFESELTAVLGFSPSITYHPRKPLSYLTVHPVSNIMGETEGFDFLSPREMVEVMQTRRVFPPPELGCYQIALMSNGQVYGCCEGITHLGKITDEPIYLIEQLAKRLETWSAQNELLGCLGCSQPDFVCGIKQYLQMLRTEKRYD